MFAIYIYTLLRIRFQQKGFLYKYYLTGKEVVVSFNLNFRIHRYTTGEVWVGVGGIKNTHTLQLMKNVGVCILKLLFT